MFYQPIILPRFCFTSLYNSVFCYMFIKLPDFQLIECIVLLEPFFQRLYKGISRLSYSFMGSLDKILVKYMRKSISIYIIFCKEIYIIYIQIGFILLRSYIARHFFFYLLGLIPPPPQKNWDLM